MKTINIFCNCNIVNNIKQIVDWKWLINDKTIKEQNVTYNKHRINSQDFRVDIKYKLNHPVATSSTSKSY